MTVASQRPKKRVLEVGTPLRDGTVLLYVDPKEDLALFLPKKVFVAKAAFDNQAFAIFLANQAGLHGHRDWRQLKEEEYRILARAWGQVAPPKLQDQRDLSFWTSQVVDPAYAKRILCNYPSWGGQHRFLRDNIPVVREGSARSLKF